MTKHPCSGMTKAQREAFEAIAIGINAGHHPKTLAVLCDRGLIERGPDRVLGRDAFGLIEVPTYQVPLLLHYQWCCWCSENVTDEELEAAG